jgi:hypothetical protein
VTEGHRKIVYDLKELASSCGISVTGVNLEMRKNWLGAECPPTPAYSVLLRVQSNSGSICSSSQEDESGKDLLLHDPIRDHVPESGTRVLLKPCSGRCSGTRPPERQKRVGANASST